MENEENISNFEGIQIIQNKVEDLPHIKNQDKPLITIFIGLICIVLFFGINSESNPNSWDIFFKWGAPSANDIWNGHFWGLLTSNFLHVDFLHLVFNLYWLWIFGKIIESQISKISYLTLIITSGFFTSALQLAFSDSTGIGFSGIGYAMFGFIYVNSKLDKSNKWFLEKQTITLFLFWLFFCIFLSYTKIWQIGNAAHFSGLFWGVLIGYLTTISIRWLKFAIPIFIFTVASIPLFWAPWSIGWLSNQAFKYHTRENYEQAKIYYSKILEKEPTNNFALENLKSIQITQLSIKVRSLLEKQDFINAKINLKAILEIDPDNQWAQEVSSMFP